MPDPRPDTAGDRREEIDRLLDDGAVRTLVARYADVVTRRAFEELHELFVEDMPLHLDLVTSPVREMRGAAEVGSFIDGAIQRFSFFEFVPLNVVVDLYPDGERERATARVWMCEVRCSGSDPTGDWSTAYGLYRDSFVRTERGWRFATRRYRSLARTGPEGAVLPFPDIDP